MSEENTNLINRPDTSKILALREAVALAEAAYQYGKYTIIDRDDEPDDIFNNLASKA